MLQIPHRDDEMLLNAAEKGLPGDAIAIDPGTLATRGWNLLREDLPLPVAVLHQGALLHNARWMQDFIAQSGVDIAPHGKTTMSPSLFDLQLATGAWGITVATVHQFQVARRFGYRRLVLANQLVGRAGIEAVLAALKAEPALEFWCLVDSMDNVAALADAARRLNIGRPLRLLVEMGYPGGRTGCRDLAGALAVARAVRAAAPFLALGGIEGFEGLIHHIAPAESVARVGAFLDTVAALAEACAQEGLFAEGEILLSAGGSIYYDLVATRLRTVDLGRATRVVLRSGCYITHDDVLYRRMFEALRQRRPELATMDGGLRPALEIWAYVQSRPEAEKAIVGFGKRDASYDDPPVALKWFRPGGDMAAPAPMPEGHRVTSLNDQHCHFAIPADSPLRVGDMIAFGISHPCLTFDKWRVMQVVNEAYDCISAIRTYF